MKKIIVTLIFFVISIMPLMAQYDKEADIDMVWSIQFNRYGEGWTKVFNEDVYIPISDRWRVGGGFFYWRFQTSIEQQNDRIPYMGLSAERKNLGLNVNAQYLLADSKCGRHSLIARLSIAWSEMYLTAEDARAMHIVSNDEFEYTSYSYSIIPMNEKRWGIGIQVTPHISYAYDWKFIHLEFGVGYDLINHIEKKYRDTPTTLSSDWEGFDDYYPEITVNPFTDWNCGREISKINGGHISFSIGLNLMKI